MSTPASIGWFDGCDPDRNHVLGAHVSAQLRHRAVAARGPVEIVQRLLGHVCIATTDTYTHLNVEDARRALVDAGWLSNRTTAMSRRTLVAAPPQPTRNGLADRLRDLVRPEFATDVIVPQSDDPVAGHPGLRSAALWAVEQSQRLVPGPLPPVA